MTDTDQSEHMTESDEPTDDDLPTADADLEETASEPLPDFGLVGQRQGYVENHFGSEEALLAYLETGRELTALEGIGRVVEARILQHVEREHPDVYEEYEDRKEYRLFDGDVFTPGAGPASGSPRFHK